MDIARRVGTSHAVVSKVLHGGRSNVGVNRDLRGRIEQVAQEMGYRPSAAARALRSGSFQCIGVLTGGVEANIYLPQATLAAMSHAFAQRGYTVSLLCCTLGPDGSLLDSALLRTHQIDSLVVSTVSPPTAHQRVDLGRLDMPVIWMNQYEPYHCVSLDEAGAADMLVEHLVEQGHRRIQFVDFSTGLESPHTLQRVRGFQQAMARHGLEPLMLALPRIARVARPGVMANSLDQPHRPTAVIVNSCTSALTLMQVAAARGLRVPLDLAIATFDDGTMRDVATPTLTTATAPTAELGRAAADMVLRALADAGAPAPSRSLPFVLQVGGSTVPTLADPASSPVHSEARP
jgi:DNA-binding LacI/PurR family transcriptional regulator